MFFAIFIVGLLGFGLGLVASAVKGLLGLRVLVLLVTYGRLVPLKLL